MSTETKGSVRTPQVVAGSGHVCVRVVWLTGLLVAVLLARPALSQKVDLPIVQRPGEHEFAQFGYSPWYVCNPPAFDSKNRPYIRSRTTMPHETGYIHTLRDGRWTELDFHGAVTRAYPSFESYRHAGGNLSTRVTFDADDWLYTPLQIQLEDGRLLDIIVYSTNYGESFHVAPLPGREPKQTSSIGALNMEYRVGHNTLTRPPLLAMLRWRDENPHGKWTHHYDLYLVQPSKLDGRLEMGEPIHVTENGLYMSRHAGNPSFAVSAGRKTFFTWAETTINDYVPGTPTFVATFDPETRQVSGQQFVGFGYMPNNGHNSPGIAIDGEGYLHTLTGSHGENFMYSRSLEPYSTEAGMSDPQPSLQTGWVEHLTERGRQTYVSLVCDADDTLHSVFRQWYKGTQPWYEDDYFGGLAHLRKPAGEGWEERSRPLVVPPVEGYAIYHQNLAVDRRGRLFVSYSYGSGVGLYDSLEGEFHYQAMLMSDDGGESWRLARSEDFAAGMAAEASADAALNPARVRIEVVGPDGQPLEGVAVSTPVMHWRSDAAGRVELDDVLAEQVRLRLRREGYETKQARVDLSGVSEYELRVRMDAVE